jgi:dGTPase
MENPWFQDKFREARYDSQDLGVTTRPDAEESPEDKDEEKFKRSTGQVDRDRILYSGHFLRLAEVTQTVSPVHGYVFHNRLSHSLKVAHVSRRLCERLKRRYKNHKHLAAIVETLDPDICEAVGLAHDLGHPPYGHSTEKELNKLASNKGLECDSWLSDAFEGNAQSFRIVCRLAGTHLPGVFDDKQLGLNLSRQTLNGILKYPYLKSSQPKGSKKWGAYQEEEKFLDFARAGIEGTAMSLEAEIMDWADDITFAVHDLLDFFSAGNIPLYLFVPRCGVDCEKHPARGKELLGDLKSRLTDERLKFIEDIINASDDSHIKTLIENAKACYPDAGADDEPHHCINAALDDIFDEHLHLFDSRYTGTPSQRRHIAGTTFEMIEECLTAFRLKHDPQRQDGLGQWRVTKANKKVLQIEILKQFTWHYIIRGQQLHSDQIGQRHAVRTVFEESMQAAHNPKESYLFPWHTRELMKRSTPKERTRHVIDYVASMSEPELMRIYRQLVADNGYRH